MEMVPFKQGKEPKDLILLIRPAWSWSLKGIACRKPHSTHSIRSTHKTTPQKPLSPPPSLRS